MTLDIETVVAVSMMMAVFSAVAAIGSSIILGAGFERLRAGFEIVRKQTGFFSDALHKLESKVELVDQKAGDFSHSIHTLEAKVEGVGEQANAFTQVVQSLEQKVDIVDKQTGFFSESIHKLEQKVDLVSSHEQVVAEKLEENAANELISTDKAEALVSHAENLLDKMTSLATHMHTQKESELKENLLHSENLSAHTHMSLQSQPLQYAHHAQFEQDSEEIHYH